MMFIVEFAVKHWRMVAEAGVIALLLAGLGYIHHKGYIEGRASIQAEINAQTAKQIVAEKKQVIKDQKLEKVASDDLYKQQLEAAKIRNAQLVDALNHKKQYSCELSTEGYEAVQEAFK